MVSKLLVLQAGAYKHLRVLTEIFLVCVWFVSRVIWENPGVLLDSTSASN